MKRPSAPVRTTRRRATVVVTCAGHVALIARRRGAAGRRRYWTLPGGGIEPGETPRDAARREVLEELGLHVEPRGPLAEVVGPNGRLELLFVAEHPAPVPPLHFAGPELSRPGPANAYEPVWVPVDDLPAPLRAAVEPELLTAIARGTAAT